MHPEHPASELGWRAVLRRPTTTHWAVALVALLAVLWAGRTFAVTVVVSVTLAVLLWPLVRHVERALRSRTLAAMLVVAMAFAGTLGLSFVVATRVRTAAQRTPDVVRLAARDVASLGAHALAHRRDAFRGRLLLQAGVIAMLTFLLLCSGERLAAHISAWCNESPRVRGTWHRWWPTWRGRCASTAG